MTVASERERLVDLSIEMLAGSPLRHVARAAHTRFIEQLLTVIKIEIAPRASSTPAASHCRRCESLQRENEKLLRKNAELNHAVADRDQEIDRLNHEIRRVTKTTSHALSTASSFTELDPDD